MPKKERSKVDSSLPIPARTNIDECVDGQRVRILAILLGSLVFCLYLVTLCPSVPGGDGGMFIGAAQHTGVAHPPGYPLYTLIGKLFILLPLKSVAWRMNLLSAICNAGAAVFLLLTVTRWTRNAWAGVLASGLFSLSPLIWRYSVVAEVFALNNLFVGILFYLTVRYWRERRIHFAYAGALIFGLALSNHHTFIFIGIPLSLFVVGCGRQSILNPATMTKLIGLALLGLVPYVYLPIAASTPAPVTWGDPSTVDGFLTHFFRKEFGTFRLAPAGSKNSFTLATQLYCRDIFRQTLYIGPVLALIGLIRYSRQTATRAITGVSLICFLFYYITFHLLANVPLNDPFFYEIHIRFWMQANFIVCLWIGLGFDTILRLINCRRPVVVALVVFMITIQAIASYDQEDQSDNWLFHHFGRQVLEPLPPNSILLTRGDSFINIVRYLQYSERIRTDVQLIDRSLMHGPWLKRQIEYNFPNINVPGDFYSSPNNRYYKDRDGKGYSLKDFFDANIGDHPIFVSKLNQDEFGLWQEFYQLRPFGFVYQVVPKGAPDSVSGYVADTTRAMAGFGPHRFVHKIRPGSWEEVIYNLYWKIDDIRAKYLVDYAAEHGQNPEALIAAARILEDVIEIHPQPDPQYYKNLGIIYYRLRSQDRAYVEQMIKAWTRYLAMNTEDDEETEKIRRQVLAHQEIVEKRRTEKR